VVAEQLEYAAEQLTTLRIPSAMPTEFDVDAEDSEEQGLFEQHNVVGEEEANVAGINDVSNRYENNADSAPLYVQTATGDTWELTWPIWHMLPRDQRRAIATEHGMKTIGEFEEYMILNRAVDDSGGGGHNLENSDGALLVAADNDSSLMSGLETAIASASIDSPPSAATKTTWYPPFIGQVDDDDDDNDDDESDSSFDTASATNTTSSVTTHNNVSELEHHMEMIRLGGLPCSLPDEILHKIFAHLPIDDHANLALVSPHWSRFTRCEALYKNLCERIYLHQSKRKTLHISRFNNSYRSMLELRPRVRTGSGLYVLKYTEVRKIQRDMWTEIPVGAILESVYYRYLYFFEDGRVMYALTHVTPLEMIPRFRRMLVHGQKSESKDKWGVWGRYEITKDVVRVWIAQAWHEVCFQLKVIPSNKELHYDSGDRGVCTSMCLEMHMSSVSGNFGNDSIDLVKYEIPGHSYFRFLRDRRL